MLKFTLETGRGTKLLQNSDSPIALLISPSNPTESPQWDEILMIMGTLIVPINHLGRNSSNNLQIIIPPFSQYMVINSGKINLILSFESDPTNHEILYDPYLFEKENHKNYDPEEFKAQHTVPDGYIDILPKWYSIKFTYPDYNYIFISPGVGISLQMHAMREEHWEILQGQPIIIAGSKISYNTKLHSQFDIPLGAFHTVINPSNSEWVLIKESCRGKFDEEDIVRIFNPNHYFTE
ncbi:hypothetical protein DSAG12_01189 [Promethearchaeum syntrophicum]|uniref:Mannose-6-phosphate isomerase type II C-terminal domain-containing protein n=1 Tax=Promethearchaeum syntrophicum TaxID=2594042 RepID=A0A5B9D8A5_9ARCH|nr:hypothetical protein [Candidatus Prometheoarchaeum syntrophicum]QEE15364.1 Mannose-6-phosphate isomerase [Candidatus Prometheoarchaeum syntrophicum]